MATPATLHLDKFCTLLSRFHDADRVFPLPCPGLARLIEIRPRLRRGGRCAWSFLIDQCSPRAIVLGCTITLSLRRTRRLCRTYWTWQPAPRFTSGMLSAAVCCERLAPSPRAASCPRTAQPYTGAVGALHPDGQSHDPKPIRDFSWLFLLIVWHIDNQNYRCYHSNAVMGNSPKSSRSCTYRTDPMKI